MKPLMNQDAKCKKIRYADEETAEYYLNKLKETSKRKLKPTRVYLCEKCFTWHLTSIGYEAEYDDKTASLQLENKRLKGKITHLESLGRGHHNKLIELNKKHSSDTYKITSRLEKVTADFELLKVCLTIIVMK